VQWQTYSIAETGTSVDLPTSIFTEKAERPAGYEIRLKTADGRAELTVLAGPIVTTRFLRGSSQKDIRLRISSTRE
jgi:hypothetical protein